MKTITHLSIFLIFALLLAACGASTNPVQPTTPPSADTPVPAADTPAASGEISFSADILPVLESRCISCHGGARISSGLDLTSYTNLMSGSSGGAVVIPGDAASSPLAQAVLSGEMPKSGPKLTSAQTQLIVDWINQGGLDN